MSRVGLQEWDNGLLCNQSKKKTNKITNKNIIEEKFSKLLDEYNILLNGDLGRLWRIDKKFYNQKNELEQELKNLKELINKIKVKK